MNQAMKKQSQDLIELIKFLKKILFWFVVFLGCLKGGECLIKWNTQGEILLSLSVAITVFSTIFLLINHKNKVCLIEQDNLSH